MEVFKEIDGFEDYQVSTLGRVKSLKFGKEKILKPFIGPYGYYQVKLWNGKGLTINIQKLVAMAFLDHKPNGHVLVIDHINNNPLDNRLENLQLITQRENCSKDKNNVGVRKIKNRWQSSIRINNAPIYLGSFKTKTRASISYDLALYQLDKFRKYA